MDPALAGIIGAIVGALTGFSIAFFSHLWQSRREQIQWLREKREEAYSNAISSLLHLINKRSAISADGRIFLHEGDVKEWFDDYSDAQRWVTQVGIYCSSEQAIQRIHTKAATLKSVFDGFLSGKIS